MIAFRVQKWQSLPRHRNELEKICLTVHTHGYEAPDVAVMLLDAKNMAEVFALIDSREDGGWGLLGRRVDWDDRSWQVARAAYMGYGGDVARWDPLEDVDGPFTFEFDVTPLPS
jgi:hypothetical protein